MINEIHKKVLDFIMDSIEQKGYPPSVREICSQLSIKSTSTVHKYLGDLEEEGYIVRENAKNRSIRVVRQGGDNTQTIHVPVLGTVAAGQPILAQEQAGEYISFETSHFSRDQLFALKVKGDSMTKAGIFEGDFVIANRTPIARNGEIIVALVGDEATVKTFYKEYGRYRLQPENDTMEPIYVKAVLVLGRVIAVIRYLE